MWKGKQQPAVQAARLLMTGLTLICLAPVGAGARPKRREATISDIVTLACFDKQWPIDGDGCLFFNGGLAAGDFFRGMRRIDSRDGPVFRKGGRSFRYFPDQVSVQVIVNPDRCGKDGRAYQPWLPPPVDLLQSVHAEAAYIRDLRMHPLEINLAEQGTAEDLLGQGSWGWQYRFVIETKGVELQDPIVVSLVSAGGKKLAQCPFRLAGPGEWGP